MTIKTQGGKVVTKDGKVSCECCDTECGIYPAQKIKNNSNTIEDFPQTLRMGGFGGFPEKIVTKTGFSPNPNGFSQTPIYASDDYDPFNGTGYRILYVGIFSDAYWRHSTDGSSSFLDFLLMDPNGFGNRTKDNFADTYFVSGPISGSVSRIDLCTWVGTGLRLKYDGRFIFLDPPNAMPTEKIGNFIWQVNGNNKTGFQNTPVGSYAGGFTVS
jgi:hypothetical protein